MPTIRTTTHSYPQGEIDAMREYYRGKRCVVTLEPDLVQWTHMLDDVPEFEHPAGIPAALPALCVELGHSTSFDGCCSATSDKIATQPTLLKFGKTSSLISGRLVLPYSCTRILSRGLQFERELKHWRLAEIQAGRGDPGRPGYGYVFMTSQGTSPPTRHRWHASVHYRGVTRNTPDDTDMIVFRKEQCPGIDPPHPNPFPVIDTLLSIPFSLEFNLPRARRIRFLVMNSPCRWLKR